jgi:dienelactone hydrolase
MADDDLADFETTEFTHAGKTRTIFRTGTGPAVIVMAELPGITPKVAGFARKVAAIGCTAVMPHLFGEPGRDPAGASRGASMVAIAKTIGPLCVSREFTMWAANRTSPVVEWLRALADHEHEVCGGPGVGAIGMCFTGGYALAMMIDDWVAAPVVAQPAAPFAVGAKRGADLGLSPADRDAVVARAEAGCPVLGVRYAEDKAVGTRFTTLRELLGDKFTAVELPGQGHSTLTEERSQEAVDAVVEFLGRQLRA